MVGLLQIIDTKNVKKTPVTHFKILSEDKLEEVRSHGIPESL
jgi:hypothetical protein